MIQAPPLAMRTGRFALDRIQSMQRSSLSNIKLAQYVAGRSSDLLDLHFLLRRHLIDFLDQLVGQLLHFD